MIRIVAPEFAGCDASTVSCESVDEAVALVRAVHARRGVRAPAVPHDARETTEVQVNQEDTRETPSSTLSSQGSTATNLNGR